jgi:hypothetical protein
MGEVFKREQAKRFQHRHDVAYRQLRQPDLLQGLRKDILVHDLTCETDIRDLPAPGSPVVLYVNPDHTTTIADGTRIIGRLALPDGEFLDTVVKDCGGVARGTVAGQSSIPGYFNIHIEEQRS